MELLKKRGASVWTGSIWLGEVIRNYNKWCGCVNEGGGGIALNILHQHSPG